MAIPEIKLTPEDKQRLLDLAPDIAALHREIAKAESAGYDVKQLKADLAEAEKKRAGTLRVYG